MSLGIAGIGAIFFALAGGHGQHVPVYLHAAEWTALATVGLLAASFAVAFGLPRRARSAQGPLDSAVTRWRGSAGLDPGGLAQFTAERTGNSLILMRAACRMLGVERSGLQRR